MDGPLTPYREGKPLAEIIPPDRRRVKTLALVLASMTTGIALWVLGGLLLEMRNETNVIPVPTTTGYVAGRIGPAVLHGPGLDAPMPPRQRSVIHVWLQGCQDCMPKFEAMRTLESEGGLGVTVPIYNVAYGEAEPAWAERYGVRKNLVFDVGGRALVKPLGIGTFTTLVVDADGAILLRDSPDRPGYRDRVRAAVGASNTIPTPFPRDPLPPDLDDGKAPPLDSEAVQKVVAAHRMAMKRACWRNDSAPSASSNVIMNVTIAPDGGVAAVTSTGNDVTLQKCLEGQIRSWRFPASPSTTTITIPITFVKE